MRMRWGATSVVALITAAGLAGAGECAPVARAAEPLQQGWTDDPIADLIARAHASSAAEQAAAVQTPPAPPARPAQAAPPAAAATTPPAAPRRRINPYDRDIPITAPLSFNRRILGEVNILLTRDDRFLIDARQFVSILEPLLNEQGRADIQAALAGRERFEGDALRSAGITLDYDPAALALLVVRIDPDKRNVESLFEAPRAEAPEEAPRGFSAYLNTNVAINRRESTGDVDTPSVFLDGAIRLGGVVFEADVQGREDAISGEYELARRFARLVYDQPEALRRWEIGDLDPEIRGRQGVVELGGVGVTRQRRRFDPFRAGVIQGDRRLVLRDDSTVRVLRNGVLVREFRLQAGQYDLSNLPLETGSNAVEVQVRDDRGLVQNLSYRSYLDSIDLAPGDHEYGAYLGYVGTPGFGSPDYSEGEIAFSGFFRKAFVDRPAVGLVTQLSSNVQMLNGQTQIILPNAGRFQFDGAVSNSERSGGGFAAGITYDQFFDRGDTQDNLILQADYLSDAFATLGSPDGGNPTAWVLGAAYSRSFTERFYAALQANYRTGRGESQDAYRVGALGTYRISRTLTTQFGVEYVELGRETQRSGFGVNFALVWQPTFDRRIEGRYSSATNSGSASFIKAGEGRVGSYGYSALASYDDGPASVSVTGEYVANRFDAGVVHTAFGRSFEDVTDEQVTSLRVGSSIAFAGGRVGVGRRIFDSFALLKPHPNLEGRPVIAGDNLELGRYQARSGPLGAAVAGYLSSYINQNVRYDVLDAPQGYDIGEGIKRVRPAYRSGYFFEIGSEAFVSAVGALIGLDGKPIPLASGRLRPVDQPDAEPDLFFTNSVGRFAVQNLTPGKRYRVELFSQNVTAFEFSVPADSAGLLDLKSVTLQSAP